MIENFSSESNITTGSLYLQERNTKTISYNTVEAERFEDATQLSLSKKDGSRNLLKTERGKEEILLWNLQKEPIPLTQILVLPGPMQIQEFQKEKRMVILNHSVHGHLLQE